MVQGDGTISEVYDMNDDGSEETLAELMAEGVETLDFRGKLIVPGFVDAHAHAPQARLVQYRCRIASRELSTARGEGCSCHPSL